MSTDADIKPFSVGDIVRHKQHGGVGKVVGVVYRARPDDREWREVLCLRADGCVCVWFAELCELAPDVPGFTPHDEDEAEREEIRREARLIERANTDALIARFQGTLHGSDYDTIQRLNDYLKRNLESEGE